MMLYVIIAQLHFVCCELAHRRDKSESPPELVLRNSRIVVESILFYLREAVQYQVPYVSCTVPLTLGTPSTRYQESVRDLQNQSLLVHAL